MTRTVSSQRGLDGPSDTSPPTLAGDSCARTTRPASTIRERTSLMRGLMSGIRRDRPRTPGPGPRRHPAGSRRMRLTSKLAGGGERELAAPPREQRGAQRAVGGIRELGVAGDDAARLPARIFDQARVAQEVSRAELGQPRLARAEKLAGASQLEVDLGDPEAVVRRRHGVDPPLGLLAQVAGRQQDAVRPPPPP